MMNPLEIRPIAHDGWKMLLARMGDFDAAGTLGFALTEEILWRHTFGDPDYSPELLLGAYADGTLAACGMGILRPWKSPTRGFVKFIHGTRPAIDAMLVELEDAMKKQSATELIYGGSSPWYVTPGVPVGDTATSAPLIAAGWTSTSIRLSQSVHVASTQSTAHPIPIGYRLTDATEQDKTALLEFIESQFSLSWAKEALSGGNGAFCSLIKRNGGILGFAAMHATNPNWFGPMGVKTNERGKGLGNALLHQVLARLHREKTGQIILPWINDKIGFYEKALGKTACSTLRFEKFSKPLHLDSTSKCNGRR